MAHICQKILCSKIKVHKAIEKPSAGSTLVMPSTKALDDKFQLVANQNIEGSWPSFFVLSFLILMSFTIYDT